MNAVDHGREKPTALRIHQQPFTPVLDQVLIAVDQRGITLRTAPEDGATPLSGVEQNGRLHVAILSHGRTPIRSTGAAAKSANRILGINSASDSSFLSQGMCQFVERSWKFGSALMRKRQRECGEMIAKARRFRGVARNDRPVMLPWNPAQGGQK
jgi:hypothetical protein